MYFHICFRTGKNEQYGIVYFLHWDSNVNLQLVQNIILQWWAYEPTYWRNKWWLFSVSNKTDRGSWKVITYYYLYSMPPTRQIALTKIMIIWFFRYMVARKDIKAGQLIFKNTPLSVGPNQNAKCVCIVCFDQVNIWSYILTAFVLDKIVCSKFIFLKQLFI